MATAEVVVLNLEEGVSHHHPLHLHFFSKSSTAALPPVPVVADEGAFRPPTVKSSEEAAGLEEEDRLLQPFALHFSLPSPALLTPLHPLMVAEGMLGISKPSL